jgi:hypothetical protein
MDVGGLHAWATAESCTRESDSCRDNEDGDENVDLFTEDAINVTFLFNRGRRHQCLSSLSAFRDL